jgi:hypothetical protein
VEGVVNTQIQGYMGEHELQWLEQQAARMQTIVEIGSFKGRSTYSLCEVCPGTVYAVDHFKGSPEHQGDPEVSRLYEIFMKNVGHFKNLVVLNMSSEDAAKDARIPQKVDMIFVDGRHDEENVRNDFRLWRHRAAKLFCGHDMSESGIPAVLNDYKDTIREVGVGSLWKEDTDATIS